MSSWPSPTLPSPGATRCRSVRSVMAEPPLPCPPGPRPQCRRRAPRGAARRV